MGYHVLVNTSGNKPKGAIYLRISSDPGNDERGVARQEKRGRAFCEDFGLEPVIFRDNDTSATSGVCRVQYEKLVAAVDDDDSEIRMVWAWGLDRLCRSPGEFEVFMKIAKHRGTMFADRTGVKNLSRAGDRFSVRNAANAAAYEIENMKERQQEAFDQLASDGLAFWNQRPFGYTKPVVTTYERIPPTIVEEEAALIRQAYHDILTGRSLKAIAREWNAAGVRTPERKLRPNTPDKPLKRPTMAGGNPWTGETLKQLLLAPRNAALRERTRTEPGPNGHSRLVSREIVTDASGNPVPVEWEPIIELDIYKAVVAIFSSRPRGTNAWVRQYLLSGLLRCGQCDGGMSGTKYSRRGKVGNPIYVCTKCHGTRRRIDKVDALVTGLVINYLADHKVVERKLSNGVDTGAMRARLIELDGVEQELSEALGAGMKFALIKPQMDVVNAERVEINAKLDAQPHRIKPLEKLLAAADIAEEFAAMKLDQQRAVIDTLFTITILPGQRSGRAPFDPALVRVEPKL